MPRQKSWKPKDRKDTKLESTARKSNERSSGASESDSDDPMEKDETELELEKLVFGDDAGFQEGLKSYRTDVGTLDIPEDGTENIQSEGLSGIVQDLEVLNDADVFKGSSGF